MNDFVTDGQPFENPIGAATEGYLNTPPTFARGLGAFFGQSSTTQDIGRGVERSAFQSMTDREEGEAQGRMAAADPDLMSGQPPREDYFAGIKAGPAIPTPTLSAEEANKKYAPSGADGKPVSITDRPISDGAAQLIGKAKTDEITREDILRRFSQAHSLPVTFATGLAAFMLDPLNAASTFLPGVGEETALAGLGRVGLETGGVMARTGARLIAGGTAGVVAQAPVTALRYSLGQGEASDYDFREAFRDMMYAAAGGAVLHAGFGGAREAGILRPDTMMDAARRPVQAEGAEASAESARVLPEGVDREAATILNADAPTKADAMRAAVSQMADGREVDVEPVFKAREQDPAAVATAQRGLYRDGFVPGVPQGELEATGEAMYGPKLPSDGTAEAAAEAPPTAPKAEVGATEAPEGQPATPLDHDLAAAEAQFSAMQQGGATIHPDDAAEINQSAEAMTRAQSIGQAAQEAAACLAEAAA